MGTFLSMTSVVGKTKDEVVKSLSNYAKTVNGGLEKEALSIDSNNCCVVEEANGNTTVFNPYAYLEWDKSAEYISRELSAAVFSFHVHDGDLWMYVLFVNGEAVDQFNPIPDYWEESISDEEMKLWKGDAKIIASYVSSIKPADIARYLVRWDVDAEESKKAYANDEYEQEDWQLLDFMRKLGLPYPLNDNGEPKAETYRLWTNALPFEQTSRRSAMERAAKSGDDSD